MQTSSFSQRLVCSPCCLSAMTTEEIYPAYQKLGFTKYEAFSSWTRARHGWTHDPIADQKLAASHGLKIISYHLPPITDDVEVSLAQALQAARYASQLGVGIVLLKTTRKELFGIAGKRFLDAVESEKLNLTTVVQNHAGSAITTPQDYRDVFALFDHDPRLRAILEVGHFQRIGVSWREGWDLLRERIALIHVNEIRAGKSVPYGAGEVDFSGLMKQIKTSGYGGDIVVELELETNHTEPQETLDGLRDAIHFLTRAYDEG